MAIKLLEGYKSSLKHALDHTRKVFAEMDGCEEHEVPNFHPSQDEIEIEQGELFNDDNTFLDIPKFLRNKQKKLF